MLSWKTLEDKSIFVVWLGMAFKPSASPSAPHLGKGLINPWCSFLWCVEVLLKSWLLQAPPPYHNKTQAILLAFSPSSYLWTSFRDCFAFSHKPHYVSYLLGHHHSLCLTTFLVWGEGTYLTFQYGHKIDHRHKFEIFLPHLYK